MNIQEFRKQYPEYNDMADQALADSLYQKSYSDMDRKEFDSKFLGINAQPQAGQLSPTQPQESKMPMADWVDQFQPENLFTPMPTGREWARIGLNQLPVLGAVTGGALGLPLGPPGMAGGAALGAGMGEVGRQAISQGTGLEQPGTVRENIGNTVQQAILGGGSALIPGGQGFARPILGGALTMGGSEAAKQGVTGQWNIGKIGIATALGGGVGLLGEGIGRGIDKMFFGEAAPLAEKAGSSFIEFAKKNNLPFSIDALASKPSLALTQAAADYGPGMIISNWQRGKLIEKTTQLSKMVNTELGLIAPVEMDVAANELSAAIKNLVTKSKTHADWNREFGKLPENTRIDAQNLMDTVEKIGGSEAIEDLFLRSGHTSKIGTAINRVYARDGEYDKRDLEYILNNINTRYRQLHGENNWEGSNNVKELKAAIMEDIAYTQIPELQTTLKAVRAANDATYSKAQIMLNNYPIIAKLLVPSSNKPAITLSLFSEGNVPAMVSLREKLLATSEGTATWELLQSSYLKRVFDNALVNRVDFSRKVFDPGKYLDWYEKYGSAASKIMPETANALQEWAQVSQGILKDYGRRVPTLSALKIAGASLGIGGAGGLMTAGPVGMVAIPGFSVLASLATMGSGKWGFIRNNLTKQAAQPISMGSRLLSIPPQMEAMEAAK